MQDTVLPHRPLVLRVGKKLRPAVNKLVARYSAVPDAPVMDCAAFPWIAGLTANWRAIRDEAAAILAHREAVPPLKDVSPDHARIAGDGKWKSFFLTGYGHRIDDNCRRCPETARLVDQVPGLNSAFFSILDPGARIPAHRGVTKGLLTCHIGLIVPKGGDCAMRVDQGVVRWREGGCLAFDDTYEHEVWNDTGDSRVILLVQFKRPVRFPGSLAADAFLWGVRRSAFVRDAVDNLGGWEEAYRKAEANEPA